MVLIPIIRVKSRESHGKGLKGRHGPSDIKRKLIRPTATKLHVNHAILRSLGNQLEVLDRGLSHPASKIETMGLSALVPSRGLVSQKEPLGLVFIGNISGNVRWFVLTLLFRWMLVKIRTINDP